MLNSKGGFISDTFSPSLKSQKKIRMRKITLHLKRICSGEWFGTFSHCSYLDIYISQNIRLCKGDFEGQFQTTLQAKGINFLIWKFRFIILIFLLVFAEFVKSTAFYTLLLLFQRVDISKLWFLHQNAIQACQLFEIAATVCKKQWIWQILQKIEGKWE